MHFNQKSELSGVNNFDKIKSIPQNFGQGCQLATFYHLHSRVSDVTFFDSKTDESRHVATLILVRQLRSD